MTLQIAILRVKMLIQHWLYVTRPSGMHDGHHRPLELARLEERVLLSASAMAPIAAEMATAVTTMASSVSVSTMFPEAGSPCLIMDEEVSESGTDLVPLVLSESRESSTAADSGQRLVELVFVDSSIGNVTQVMADLNAQNRDDESRTLQFIVLDSESDGIRQITSALQQNRVIDGLHIVSRGESDGVHLGSTTLSITNLDPYRAAISDWRSFLSDEADLMFYGCSLEDVTDGQQLLSELSRLVQCNICECDNSTADSVDSETTTLMPCSFTSENLQEDLNDEGNNESVDVVLIDSRLENHEVLAQAAVSGAHVIRFDGSHKSANQVLSDVIDWAAMSQSRISSLSILSHGMRGAFQLGDQWIMAENLEETAAGWQDLSSFLTEEANIEIFGCDVAKPGGEGQRLLNQIAALTGADLFASTNITGRSGNWQLEAASDGDWNELETGLTSAFDSSVLATYDGDMVVLSMTGTTLSYTENAGAVVIDSGITVGGLLAISSATVTVSGNYVNGEDILAFSNQFSITGSWDAGTGVLTLSGTDTQANYQTALRSVTYRNTSEAPSTLTRTITVQASDILIFTAWDSRNISITAVNDAPLATNRNAAEIFTEDTALNLTDIVVSDVDNSTTSVTLTLSNAAAGSLNTGTSGAVTSTYNAGTGIWTANGAVTDVNNLLASLALTPALNFNSNFTIATSVTDGIAAALTGTKTITGLSVNDAPVLMDTNLTMTVAEDAGLPSGAMGALVSNFMGGISDVDTGAVIGIAIVASDEANGDWYYSTNGGANWMLVGTVSPASSLLLVNDALTRLYFAPTANYFGNATLTLRGWDQTSGSPATTVSTITNGGATAFSSGTDLVEVTVSPVNDAPVISVPGAQNISEDGVLVLSLANGNAVSIDDLDSGIAQLQIDLSVSNGTLTLSTVAGLTFVTGDGTVDANMQFTGTKDQINLALNGMLFTPSADFNGGVNIAITVSDLGNTGSGGAMQGQ